MIVMFGGAPSVLGQHYYISDDTTGSIEPKWDFSSAAFPGDQQAFFIGSKVGDIPSPDGNVSNIDWVSLANVDGALADTVFRVDTIGGQPPSLDVRSVCMRSMILHLIKYLTSSAQLGTVRCRSNSRQSIVSTTHRTID